MKKKDETKSFDVHIEKRSAVPIYEQIRNAFKMALFSGKLQDGDKITSVREFNARYKTNPMTIMKAYNLLEYEGYLYPRKGDGYYIRIDKEKIEKGKRELFQTEIKMFIKRITDLGYSEEEFMDELKRLLDKKETSQTDNPSTK